MAALTCDEGGILLDGGKPQAMSLWQASGLAATLDQGGVGVIVGAAPGVVGLTVEGCRDPSGRIGEVAQRLLAGIPSYAEISPSGTGITVIATIARPDACAPFRRDGFRAYRCGEVIPVTGWHVPGTPSDVLPVEAGLFSQLREFLS
ncbi:MAG: hypothetical protein JNL80_01605 [Phycisphaerae bacterium]|nr:hypothetical protein [Phycisphaerae bacterium]